MKYSLSMFLLMIHYALCLHKSISFKLFNFGPKIILNFTKFDWYTSKINKDKLELLQTQNELGYTKSEGDFNINGQRLKAEIGYNINNWKFDPTISAEIFRESGRYTLPSFNKIRFTLGTEYKVKKIGELGIFYRVERELGVTYPLTAHILGVNFTFNL